MFNYRNERCETNQAELRFVACGISPEMLIYKTDDQTESRRLDRRRALNCGEKADPTRWHSG
jgi:hypothetical protein